MAQSSQESIIGWPVRIVAVAFVLIGIIFLYFFITFDDETVEVPETLASTTYLDVVDSLLANADSTNGPQLLVQFACTTCHETVVAPLFEGLGERAGERRPPLTAAAYIYESIVSPSAYVVDGYVDVMPRNFRQRMTDKQLGDLIAYLLEL
ncbi:MAG: hypothetical protein D6737_14855 [Chloroflexi bacterium]|nr:MAG: hypothetical protein CUN54_02500 [Phototrophicales bacterium]RMF78418.1 MAG: hypothetical protein D6737_14855 [Chloroflexota bacterium]